MLQTIIDAINNRQVLLVDYYDPRGYRRVEPHCCGVTRPGNDAVRVFQVDGPSKSHEGTGFWKMMRLDRIVDIRVLDEQFEQPRDGYQRGDSHLPEIYAEL